MSIFKVGLLGCGRISQFHLNALKDQVDLYEIAAVADIQPERAAQMAAQFGAKFYSSLDAMLQSEKLNLVVLCTPSGMHPAQAKVCAEAGVPCLSEKPFGCFYPEAQDVVEFFEKQKVPLFVVHQNRYNPTVQKVRKWFEEGKLGKLHLIQANVFWQRPQSYYDAESWRGRRELDGGAFMNQASHYVDLVQWFGGEIESVKSEVAAPTRKIQCEDTGAAVIRFKSNAIGVIAVTMLTYPENLEGSLTLLAEHATIKIGGKALNKLEICKAKDPSVFADGENTNYEPTTVYGNGHGEYYRKLHDYMTDPHHPEAINGREGLKSLKLLTEIYREQDLII
ncbi:MAG: Gfo/Idh/MocA family oxidoreductase [Gammaproteobacteria bacterium]|nr:Gfo/Idh/MocA family oxidoreductase [Gammaproteobacteria bacterium]